MTGTPSTIHDVEEMAEFIEKIKDAAKTENNELLRQASFFLEMYWNVFNTHRENTNKPNRNLDKLLVGREVAAKHPITVLNPTPTFVIDDAKIDFNKIYVRGVETAWFELGSIEFVRQVVASKFTKSEMQELENSPAALQLLIDYHDNQQSQADAMDVPECAAFSEKRRKEFTADRDRLLTENHFNVGDINFTYPGE